MGVTLKDEIRLSTLRARLEDRPNNRDVTAQVASLEYSLGLYDDAERSIARALELGHEDDGSMQVCLARIHVRRQKADTANAERHLRAALASFHEALTFVCVASRAVHYLELASVYFKLNETQRAANALSTILFKWPQSEEAALAKETCAQALLSRGQAQEALSFYKTLLVDPVPAKQAELTIEGDRAEIDLPVASGILGDESPFLQMGLCYEALHQSKMAAAAYRQAWNAILEQRLVRRQSTAIEGACGKGGRGHDGGCSGGGSSGGNGKEETTVERSNDDDIGRILLQARKALAVRDGGGGGSSGGTWATAAGWYVGDTSGRFQEQQLERHLQQQENSGEERKPELQKAAVRALTMEGPVGQQEAEQRGGGPAAAMRKLKAASEEARARAYGFEMWSKRPFTWFRLGQVVLEGGCFTLALAFLTKAVALLPPGLQKQEKDKHLPMYLRKRRKPGEAPLAVPEQFNLAQLHLLRAEAFFQMGRFSDAHAAASEARDLDPLGEAVRLRCSRLMALQSEDARSQFTLESLSAVRVQRAWRRHRVVRVLIDLVTRQIAALRIQRFMRKWRTWNVRLALRLTVASFIELSRLSGPHEKVMGSAAKAAASERLAVLVVSVLSVQRAARVRIARRAVSRRRAAIAALQAIYRGCRVRWALSTALEESLRLRMRPQLASPVGGGNGGGGGDSDSSDGGGSGEGGAENARGNNGSRPTMLPLIQQEEGAASKPKWLVGHDVSVCVGSVTRQDAPMDAEFPEGFGPPNLTAFLWESCEEAYGPGCDVERADANTTQGTPPLPVAEPVVSPRFHDEAKGRHTGSSRSRTSGGSDDGKFDGMVFEISATAVVSSAPRRKGEENPPTPIDFGPDGRQDRPPAFTEFPASPSTSSTRGSQRESLLPRWAPAVIAPQEALERALRCSTLVINSPSFGSACARRLFSRIGWLRERRAPPTPRGIPPADHPPTTRPIILPPRALSREKQPCSEPGPMRVLGGHDTAWAAQVNTVQQAGHDQLSSRRVRGGGIRHILVLGESPLGDGGLLELSSAVLCGWVPRLTTLVLGGPGFRVGPRGLLGLAVALSSPGCSRLKKLSLSDCCLGHEPWQATEKRRRNHRRSTLLTLSAASAEKTAAAAHAAWECLFRHIQRLLSLSALSLQRCGLQDRDIRSLSIALQILPSGRLRCLRLNGNCVGSPGLRMLLLALTSRRMRLPALWLRRQWPRLAESEAKGVVQDAFRNGLFAEVEFDRPGHVSGGRSQLVIAERTAESEDFGGRVRKHLTSHIYL